MPRYKVAHLNQQGVDLIIVPLESSFGAQGQQSQNAEHNLLQLKANGAGLKGTVVPVWDNGGGRMGFLAPPNFHPYFQSINLQFVMGNINREIYW